MYESFSTGFPLHARSLTLVEASTEWLRILLFRHLKNNMEFCAQFFQLAVDSVVPKKRFCGRTHQNQVPTEIANAARNVVDNVQCQRIGSTNADTEIRQVLS